MNGHQPLIDKTTNYIAAGALASPLWLPTLKDVSETAALLVPILGCVWLVIQMASWLFRRRK